MKDLHILKGLMVGLKTAIIEIVQLIAKVIYYIIRNIDNGVAYVFMKLPRLARVGVIYTMIALSIVGIFSIVPKNVDTKVIQTNVSNIVEKVETTEQVEETETTEITEQVAIVEQTTATCKIDNTNACYIYDNALVYGFTHDQALILVAMSRHETGGWESELYVNSNNFAGIKHSGKFAKYNTKEEGLNNFFYNMKKYIDNGKDTIQEIGATWCPTNDPNDTKGVNKYWYGSVTNIYNQYQALYN